MLSGITSNNNGLPPEFGILEETTIPLLQMANKAYHDFIIIAEFSEVDGPIPICTIPLDAPDHIDIDVNKLAVHLMSTDYQVNTVGHFKVCEDTQVMRTNVFNNVHVFMQYFTLYDLKARGFVRPFCFGYVCKDHVKVDNNVSKFASEFDKITNILKLTNRQWFSSELEAYLRKLKLAKENYIQTKHKHVKGKNAYLAQEENEDEETVFSMEDTFLSEDISLNQIAHQYTETETILQTVNIPADPNCEADVELLFHQIRHLNPKCLLKSVLKNLQIQQAVDEFETYDATDDVENVPLTHPLKQKGESLRPLTTLGQVGTVNLVWKLMRIELQKRPDFMFSEIETLTRTFQRHCKAYEDNKISPETQESVDSDRTITDNDFKARGPNYPSGSEAEMEDDLEECENEHFEFLESDLICQILEKIHAAVPIIPDNKSGSYHSLSDESDAAPSRHTSGNENENSSYLSAAGSVESQILASAEDLQGRKSLNTLPLGSAANSIPTEPLSGCPSDVLVPDLESTTNTKVEDVQTPFENVEADVNSNLSFETGVEMRCSISSISSTDDDSSTQLDSSVVLKDESTELIEKIPWYGLISKNGSKGQAGYGLLKFFRHFVQEAHHVLYSMMIGRPVIICGSERYRSRIGQTITALIPLVPCFPEKSWKLMRWHRGILVPAHFKYNSFKLIGLCIPEKHEVHDLVNPKCGVTILNYETRSLQGPAYSGALFSNFEQKCQTKFHDDVSLMSYIGSILTEIETKVFLYKAMLDTKMKPSTILSQLDLKASDADIVKHIVGLIHDIENIVEIF